MTCLEEIISNYKKLFWVTITMFSYIIKVHSYCYVISNNLQIQKFSVKAMTQGFQMAFNLTVL